MFEMNVCVQQISCLTKISMDICLCWDMNDTFLLINIGFCHFILLTFVIIYFLSVVHLMHLGQVFYVFYGAPPLQVIWFVVNIQLGDLNSTRLLSTNEQQHTKWCGFEPAALR